MSRTRTRPIWVESNTLPAPVPSVVARLLLGLAILAILATGVDICHSSNTDSKDPGRQDPTTSEQQQSSRT
ncbi:hypothetical protein BASA50_008865 [Batrachochytrium salamandrivorans]|uniref:Uncharacterized protein n=1 Tax=Batrachochytrium salamandrivorans TaxID=1357716 RepID=A0ABQ8F304_9FUNG|nr:hypothetical protein BASA50_008865 [Batrachochytrium salamandrivorans]